MGDLADDLAGWIDPNYFGIEQKHGQSYGAMPQYDTLRSISHEARSIVNTASVNQQEPLPIAASGTDASDFLDSSLPSAFAFPKGLALDAGTTGTGATATRGDPAALPMMAPWGQPIVDAAT